MPNSAARSMPAASITAGMIIHSVGRAAEPERSIGSPCRAVKRDDARETSDVIERTTVERHVDYQIETRYQSGYIDDVDRAVAHDLVRDVDPPAQRAYLMSPPSAIDCLRSKVSAHIDAAEDFRSVHPIALGTRIPAKRNYAKLREMTWGDAKGVDDVDKIRRRPRRSPLTVRRTFGPIRAQWQVLRIH